VPQRPIAADDVERTRAHLDGQRQVAAAYHVACSEAFA